MGHVVPPTTVTLGETCLMTSGSCQCQDEDVELSFHIAQLENFVKTDHSCVSHNDINMYSMRASEFQINFEISNFKATLFSALMARKLV